MVIPQFGERFPPPGSQHPVQRIMQVSNHADVHVVRQARYPGAGSAQPAMHRVDRRGELADVQRVVGEFQ